MAEYPALQIGQYDTQNFLAGAQVAGQAADRRQNNLLLQRKMEQENAAAQRQSAYQNLLAQYMGSGESAGPERNLLIEQLYQIDPERTNKLVEFERSEQEFNDEQARTAATEFVPRFQSVLDAAAEGTSPSRMFRLMSRMSDGSDLLETWREDGTLQQLVAEGIIDSDEEITDEEAVRLAEVGIAQWQPLLPQTEPESPFAKVDPSDYTPESVAAFQASGGRKFGALVPQASEDSLTRKLDVVEGRLGRALTSEEVMKLAGGGTTINIGDKEAEKPIPVTQLPNVRLPDGSTPPLGTTFGEAEEAGARVFSTAELDRRQKTETALNTLDSLEQMAVGPNGVFVDYGGSPLTNNMLARAANGILDGLAAFGGSEGSVRRAVYTATAQGSISSLVRSMGEAGSLSDGDVQRALALIPMLGALPVTEKQARAQFKELRSIISQGAAALGEAPADLGGGVTVEWID